jgi:hypothetical protein
MRLAVLVFLAGCSLSLNRPDPHRPATTAPKCDTSKSLVAFDGVLAAGFGIAGLSLASDNQGGAAGGMLAIGALYALSAARGSSAVDECRAALSDYERAVAVRDATPPQPDADGRPNGRPTPVMAPRPAPKPAPAVQEPTRTAESEPAKAAAAASPELPRDDPAFAANTDRPRPAPAKQLQTPKPTPPPPDETWREFWREVP